MKRMLTVFLMLFSASALAQEPPFPQRGPIEITVLFPAGTSADVTARMLADGMSKHLGQRVLAVNRPGAGGAIGYKYVASQKPDGYSLVWNSNSISTTFHSGQLNFDYRAFDPVARALAEAVVLAVRADAKWKTLGELLADAKARPKAINIGNSGIGSHTHISSSALFRTAAVEVTEIPFAAAQVVPSLLGGHTDALIQFPGALSGPIKQGQVRLLASLTASRDPAFPDIPTARELGVDVALDAWRGIAAPKGTPPAVIGALETAIRSTVESAEFARGAGNLRVRPAFMPAAEFGELIAKEDAYLAKLMGAIGLKK